MVASVVTIGEAEGSDVLSGAEDVTFSLVESFIKVVDSSGLVLPLVTSCVTFSVVLGVVTFPLVESLTTVVDS